MTSSRANNMANKRDIVERHPLPSRPAMASHHSSSVPSTPHQHARDFAYRSRSPSPATVLGSHSPRSVSSEANGVMPTLRKEPARTGCKYETLTAFGRRRINYNIGTDVLERAKLVPKVTLSPDEEKKLTGDMRELYDRLIPSAEGERKRVALVKKLERILYTEWPKETIQVHIFGSSGNMLCTNESDVDICIKTQMRKLESMHHLADVLAKNGMEKVVCVPSAKVPIVKIWDPELELACDMNVNNTLALENTRMIKTYVQIDERVRPLAMIIKHWTKRRILNDAALGGTISSYTWICMILNFLQNRSPPVLPALHHMAQRGLSNGLENSAEFVDDLEKLQGYGHANKETLGELLFQFFRFYGHEFDFEVSVISVRHGKVLSRKEKHWDTASLSREGLNRLCVEEPFNTSRNLGNSADETAFRGIHLEIRRAFDLLADNGQLDKCCEQYEYPPEEKTTSIFKKPIPMPKPILSQSMPPAGRGGRSGHGRGRGGHQKGSYRRASSGAAFGNNRPPLMQSPPIGAETFGRGLHDHLFQQYQLLEMQQNSLKAQAQLLAQSQGFAAQTQAHVQIQAQTQGQGKNKAQNGDSPQKSPYPSGRGSPRGSESAPVPPQFVPGYLYRYPLHIDQAQMMAQSQSQEGTQTNPSSPSPGNSVPTFRRGTYRSSGVGENPSGSIRSQSQPARTLPNALFYQSFPTAGTLEPQMYMAYPITRSNQEAPVNFPGSGPGFGHPPPFTPTALSADRNMPREYLNYYLGESPELQPQQQDYTVPPIPTYEEIAQRRRRVSPEVLLPPAAMRRVSRSPSPLGGHFRSYSTGLRSAPISTSQSPKDGRSDPIQSMESGGLLIVNGSYSPPKSNATDSNQNSSDVAANRETEPMPPLGDIIPHDEHNDFGRFHNHPGHMYETESQRRRDDHDTQGEATAASAASAGQSSLPYRPNGLTIVSSSPVQKSPSPKEPETQIAYRWEQLNKNLSGKHVGSSQNPHPLVVPLNGSGPHEMAKSTADVAAEAKAGGGQLLSPVLETRSPSPTTSRRPEPTRAFSKPGSQLPINGLTSKESETSALNAPNSFKSPISPPSQGRADASPGEKTPISAQSSAWQKPGKNRKRKNKQNSDQRPGTDSKGQGEPMPANVADRKGG